MDNADFKVDALQEEAIMSYLRNDPKFLRTFQNDISDLFYQYLRDKQKLREPVSIGIKGAVRSGKSSAGIGIACYICELNGKRFSINNVCVSEYDFLQKIKSATENDVFVIDEQKEGVFGVGSMAKKMKIHDVQNIIAKLNISTIWITPRRFADTNSDYGLHTFGKAITNFKGEPIRPRLSKFLLYNLLEKSSGSIIPIGYVVIPFFPDIYDYGIEIDNQYQDKKDDWIEAEKMSEGNVMFNLQKIYADQLLSDPNFGRVRSMKDKILYARSVLPSEYTKQEIEDIVRMAHMIANGELKTNTHEASRENPPN